MEVEIHAHRDAPRGVEHEFVKDNIVKHVGPILKRSDLESFHSTLRRGDDIDELNSAAVSFVDDMFEDQNEEANSIVIQTVCSVISRVFIVGVALRLL